jgi:hypothetical protein
MEHRFDETKSGDSTFDTKSVVTGNFYKEPFSRLLVETTLLRPFRKSLEPLIQRGRSYRWSDPRRFFATLEALKRIPERSDATFTIVHLMEPHGPVQLRRDGSKLPIPRWQATPEQFFAELELVNEHLLETMRSLVKKSKTPPIIILQGDHGSDRGRGWTSERRHTHFEILNALHLPGFFAATPETAGQDLSPINAFGVVLRTYFGVDYEEQPGRLHELPRGYDAPFDQIDVTAEFQ